MTQKSRPKKSSALQVMVEKMRTDEQFKNVRVVSTPPGVAKISVAIATLVEPYQAMADTFAAYHHLVTTACIAWNVANFPKDQWPREINAAINELPPMPNHVRKDLARLVLDLAKRKKKLFPNDHRTIVNFQLIETKGNYRLAVAATPVPKA